MGQRQVRESDTVGDGSRKDEVMKQAVADATADAREVEREGSVRRPLIRATLKLPDGTPPPREPPLFTMHQQTGGNGEGAPQANAKQGRGRGSQPRAVNDHRHAAGTPGNNRASGNKALPDGRSGSKSRSSRRSRGRSR